MASTATASRRLVSLVEAAEILGVSTKSVRRYIAAGDLERIFGLFTQVDSSIERERGGLGIGLSLVRVLTEMHGGSVTAASEGPGRGAQFTVTIPALPE